MLMKKYDHDHDGEISYSEFCTAMIAKDYTDKQSAGLGKSHFHGGADGHDEMSVEEKTAYMKKMIEEKASKDEARRLTSLLHEFALVFFAKGRENYARKAFMVFDVDNSGKVDRYEFSCALKAGIGVSVNDSDIKLLENAFYAEDVEEIAYQDFIDFIRSHYVNVGQAGHHR